MPHSTRAPEEGAGESRLGGWARSNLGGRGAGCRREEDPSGSRVGTFGPGVQADCPGAEMRAHPGLARVDAVRSEGPGGGRVEQGLTLR